MKKFYIHLPGWVYAMTAYGANKRDCVDLFKKQYGIQRMPRGHAVWPA